MRIVSFVAFILAMLISQSAFAWEFHEVVNEITDEVTQTAFLNKAFDSNAGVHCFRGEIFVLFKPSTPPEDSPGTLVYRVRGEFDSGVQKIYHDRVDGMIRIAAGSAEHIVKNMLRGDRVVIQYKNFYTGRDITETYTLEGFREAASRLSCLSNLLTDETDP